MLASQPTISRLENQVTKREIKAIRRFFIDKFIQSYSQAPSQIVLDIDGWDAQTHGHQQLSLFHGYYQHQMSFPVLINEADSIGDKLSLYANCQGGFRKGLEEKL